MSSAGGGKPPVNSRRIKVAGTAGVTYPGDCKSKGGDSSRSIEG